MSIDINTDKDQVKRPQRSAISMARTHFMQLRILMEAQCFDDLDRHYIKALFEAMAPKYADHDESIGIEGVTVSRPDLLTITVEQYASAIVEYIESTPKEKGKSLKLGYTSSGLNKRLKTFVEQGIFIKDTLPRTGLKPINHYILVSPSKISALPVVEKKITKDPRIARKEMLEFKNQLIRSGETLFDPKNFNELVDVKSEVMFNGVLSSCIRLNSFDPRKTNIETTYLFGNGKNAEKVKINTRSASEISILDDQPTILALVSMICSINKDRQQKGKPLENYYPIQINVMLGLMEIPANGGNLVTIRQRIQRLHDTQFEIVCPPNSRFAQHFGLYANSDDGNQHVIDDHTYRFITELDWVHAPSKDGEHTTHAPMIRISIHSGTYKKLLDPEVWNTYSVPAALLRSSGMILTLYTFASRHLGRTVKKGKDCKDFSLRQLKEQLFPAPTYQNFKRTFLKQVQDHFKQCGVTWSDDPSVVNSINLEGWFFEFSICEVTKDYRIKIIRDLNDIYVGTKSIHNKILASKAPHQGALFDGKKDAEEVAEDAEFTE